MRPAQLRRFGKRLLADMLPVLTASMRPAQLRRFGPVEFSFDASRQNRFNEAGAAAPVWLVPPRPRALEMDRGFNEAGAAAPVWLLIAEKFALRRIRLQ